MTLTEMLMREANNSSAPSVGSSGIHPIQTDQAPLLRPRRWRAPLKGAGAASCASKPSSRTITAATANKAIIPGRWNIQLGLDVADSPSEGGVGAMSTCFWIFLPTLLEMTMRLAAPLCYRLLLCRTGACLAEARAHERNDAPNIITAELTLEVGHLRSELLASVRDGPQ
jgi:hypothetical protein